jgi:amino acid adenylation domain-containing protein
VALLGILKAGAAYLPLDPGYPPERVSYILADAGAAALVTDSATERRLPPPRTPIVVLDDSDDRDAIDGAPDTPPDSPAGPDNLAYVIYTSGSTGRPKGVEISHRSAVGLAHTVRESFGVRPDDRVAQFASLSFDASVWELLMAIGAGACLTIVPTSGEGASEIEGRLRDLRITVGTFPPSFLATVDPAKLPALRLVVSAGEHCAASLARAWSAGRRFVNAYGPTEATVCATFADPDGDTTPTIGRPLPGVSAHALGIDLDPLPAGVPGELHLAGIGLARGYRGRPSTTAAVFVPDPYGPSGTRLYRTRDFGRRLATGEIQHIGRIDQQVKIRGYRIECGEIESTLAGHPAVGQAAVVVTDTPAAGPQLVAYVTPGVSKPDDADSVLDPAELHRFLASALPQYMIPSRFGVLADLPRTTSGKIDRAALPELTEIPAAAEVHGNAPETPTERRIAAIWARMLGLSWVSRADNFLEIGGHSLVAAQVIAAIREELGVRRIPVRLLFELPSLSDFSTAIDATVADAMAGSAT